MSELDLYLIPGIAIIFSFLFVFFTIPSLISFCKRYNLLDQPHPRKSHTDSTPHLGGVIIFLGFLITLAIFAPGETLWEYRYAVIAMAILFCVGLWDDIQPINPWIKLFWQLFSASFMLILSHLHINSMFGLFGVNEISGFLSYLVSTLLVLTIINGVNLLDGINGLSTTITVILASFMGVWYHLTGFYGLSLFSFILVGVGFAFLKYNWTPAKLFMGDSGSMVIGVGLSFLVISFFQSDHLMILTKSPFAISKAPVIVLGALILPLIDTCRVFFLRIAKGDSPLYPDRKHLHHLLIDQGFSHAQTTVILSMSQLSFILIALGIHELSYTTALIFLISSIALLYFIFLLASRQNEVV
jgi:UDP-N-acetylmuramyl pentapeptide phosphotransferase/UDP-N-acetylglucosamine-1-phosphate transferase